MDCPEGRAGTLRYGGESARRRPALKGVIWKYLADTEDPELRDERRGWGGKVALYHTLSLIARLPCYLWGRPAPLCSAHPWRPVMFSSSRRRQRSFAAGDSKITS